MGGSASQADILTLCDAVVASKDSKTHASDLLAVLRKNDLIAGVPAERLVTMEELAAEAVTV